MTTVDIRAVGYDHGDAVALTDEVQAEYRKRYGGPGDVAPISAAEFDPPLGRFFVLYVDQIPAAMSGWRSGGPGDGDAEIKRMFVRPKFARRGFARMLLAAIEQDAAASGVRRSVLEIGPVQAEAIALYQSAKYIGIEGFGYYCGQGSFHFAKELAAAPDDVSTSPPLRTSS